MSSKTTTEATGDGRHSYTGEGTNRPVMVTVPEACRMFGVGRTKMWQLIMSKGIESRKLGQRTLLSVASIETLFETLPSGADREQHVKVTRLGRPRGSKRAA